MSAWIESQVDKFAEKHGGFERADALMNGFLAGWLLGSCFVLLLVTVVFV